MTRPLSMFQKDPSALALPPPEGQNSGILLIKDEEAEENYSCRGKDPKLYIGPWA